MSDEQRRRKALNTAANVLQYRPRSKAALVARLIEKGIEEADARYAVARLEALGYLDDRAYGRQLAESGAARGYGAARVRQMLRAKGLSAEDIDAVMADFEPPAARVSRYIAAHMDGKTPDRKLIKKVSDGLFRRGFSWDEIRAALAEYAAQIEEEPDA